MVGHRFGRPQDEGDGGAGAVGGGARGGADSDLERTQGEPRALLEKECKVRIDKEQGGVYALRDPATGKVARTGRTKDLNRREREHALDPELSDFDFEAVYFTNDYAEQRGLEEMLHIQFSPPLNKIRPIRLDNANRKQYLDAADEFLDKIQ